MILDNPTELDNLIDQMQRAWASRGKWTDPLSLNHSAGFLATEVGELWRAFEGGAGKAELSTESFDVYMMAKKTADLAGVKLILMQRIANPGALIMEMVKTAFDVIEAQLRLEDCYTRNSPIPGDLSRLAYELSSIASLAVGFVQSQGMDITEVGRMKLEQMEAKRK